MNKKICWVITDGKAGMVSQALGLAEAIGLSTIQKKCSYKLPWSAFPPYLFNSPCFLTNDSDKIEEPWPDLLISCGRQALGVSLYVKKQSKGKCFTICIQDPRISLSYFDLVLPPKHDKVIGKNVISTNMSLHRVTQEKLAEGRENFKELFIGKDKPISSVLIGGSTHRYKMNRKACEHLIQQLAKIRNNTDGTIYITASRRTSPELISMLQQFAQTHTAVILVNHEINNPYFGMLANADCFFVTDDSVNMVSEACSTGKKTYILPLLGHNEGKSKIFVRNLVKNNIVEILQEKITFANSKSYNETLTIAEQIRTILIKQRGFKTSDFKK